MPDGSTMVNLFEKLNDLKAIFDYGQRVIPVIQSIIDFTRETVPLLERINKSIAESTSKIPKAKHHISDVTHATELATTEILDLVDLISEDLLSIEQLLKNTYQDHNKINAEIDAVIILVQDRPEAVDKLHLIKEQIGFRELIPKLAGKINKIRNDAYNITISLQVQDITSQQLAAVNHLIESVQEKLSSLIINLNESGIKEIGVSTQPMFGDNISFDPHATYHKETAKQELADSLINERRNATQEEIDKLFS